ncbi:MAG: YbaB/EbfC family nucleoid-associated protein [Spirochaetaceae bacterium]|jgi:DNA-binding YbaB/EbfC family protein|nr:YbaB/EbfC family nucleoid-associated protein [Spirochaetaceae bacterium]
MNPFDLLKNAQKLQEQVNSVQDRLGAMSETGSSGGSMVEVEINGRMEVLAVRIKNDVVDPNDIPMLQDLVAAAMGQALEKIKERINRELASITGELQLPNMPGLFGGSS